MRFAMDKRRGLGWGVLIGICFFVPVLVGPQLGLPSPADRTFKLLLTVPMYIILVLFLYTIVGLITMRYWLDESGVHVRWGFLHKFVPYTEITDIIDLKGSPDMGVLVGFSWPGYIVGYYTIKNLVWANFFGVDWRDGVIVLSSQQGSLALTPDQREPFLQRLSEATGLPARELYSASLASPEENDRLDQDRGYQALIKFNLVAIALLIIYLAVFFPGSGALPIVLLFPGLALSIFAFMLGVASRMYQFMPTMAYLMFMLSIMVVIVFLVMSIMVVSFHLV